MRVFTDEVGPAFTHDAAIATFEAQTDDTSQPNLKFDSVVVADDIEEHCQYMSDKMHADWQVEIQPFYLDGKIGMKMDMACEADRHMEYVVNIPSRAMEILLSTHLLTIAKITGETDKDGNVVPTYIGLVVLQIKKSVLDVLEQFIPLAMQDTANKVNEKIARSGN